MPKIRHIAMKTTDTHKLAEFYKTTFGMVEVWRRENETNGAVYLTDGYLSLAILSNRQAAAGAPDGIDHFGFQVDDVSAIAEVAVANGAVGMSVVPPDGRFAEAFLNDPAGQRVDLSQSGWATEPLDRSALAAAAGRP